MEGNTNAASVSSGSSRVGSNSVESSKNCSTGGVLTTDEAVKNAEIALKAIRESRWSVKDILNDLNDSLLNVQNQQGELDDHSQINLKRKLNQSDANLNYYLKQLGNIDLKNIPQLPSFTSLPNLLLYDPQLEGKSTHHNLIKSYQWNKNVKTNSQIISRIMKEKLHKNDLLQVDSDKTPKADCADKTLQEIKNNILIRIGNAHKEVVFESYTCDRNPFIKVTLKNILAAFLHVTEKLIVSKVLVMAPEEVSNVKISSLSSYQVFQQLTLRATSACLYYYGNYIPVQAFELFLDWLASYKNLFNSKCKYCDRYLFDALTEPRYLPPCCRSFDQEHYAYHFDCKSFSD